MILLAFSCWKMATFLCKKTAESQVKSSVQSLSFKHWSSGHRPMYFNDLLCSLHLYNVSKVKQCWHFALVLNWELCIWQWGHQGNWHNENTQGDKNPRYPRITQVDLFTCILICLCGQSGGTLETQGKKGSCISQLGAQGKKILGQESLSGKCLEGVLSPESVNIARKICRMGCVSVLDTSSAPN